MDQIVVKVTDIEWETDDENVDLPKDVTLALDSPTKDIADALSDEYGFPVKSYTTAGVMI